MPQPDELAKRDLLTCGDPPGLFEDGVSNLNGRLHMGMCLTPDGLMALGRRPHGLPRRHP
jgi:hypothetical protein